LRAEAEHELGVRLLLPLSSESGVMGLLSAVEEAVTGTGGLLGRLVVIDGKG